MNVGFVGPQTESIGGFVPVAPNGNPMNQGTVDLGLMVFYQGLHHAGSVALGRALGRAMAHELGHELFLGHNQLGEGLMAETVDPFVGNAFTDTDKTNILTRCLSLQGSGH